jgi:FKBP-type peptidyl-prolyl cis-trans isomerase (trigger factor)
MCAWKNTKVAAAWDVRRPREGWRAASRAAQGERGESNVDVKTGIRESDGKTEVVVTLEPEEVKPHVDAYFKQISRARIPGFRPGKAPRRLLEQHFGGHEAVYDEIADDTIEATAAKAVDSCGVIFITKPVSEASGALSDGKPFTYTVYGKVKPEMELLSYDPVKITLPAFEVTASLVDKQVATLRGYYDPSDGTLSDEEFCKKAGVESIDALRGQVREALEKSRAENTDRLKEERCIDALAERLHGDVPQAYVNYTRDDILRDFFNNLQRTGQTFDAFLASQGVTREAFDADVAKQAKETAAGALALDALFKEKGFAVDDADLDEEFSKLSDGEATRREWEERGQMSMLREGLARQKAAKWLLETAEVAYEEADAESGDEGDEE